MQPGQLEIVHEAEGNRHRLVLRGELDLATSSLLEIEVQELCAGGAEAVLLDLSELGFVDSTGFRAILAAKERCARAGCELLMTRGPEPVQRLFDVGGVLKKLPFVGAGEPEADS